MLGSANALNMQLLSLLLLGLSPSLVLGFPKFKWPSGSGGGGGNTVTYGSHGKDSKCKPSNPPNRKHNEHVAQCLHGDHAVSIDSCYKMLGTISNKTIGRSMVTARGSACRRVWLFHQAHWNQYCYGPPG